MVGKDMRDGLPYRFSQVMANFEGRRSSGQIKEVALTFRG
jgi:hypothetical protein